VRILAALVSAHSICCALVIAGLGKGGQQIQSCRKAYLSAIQLLVQLANLQTAFMTLDTALKVTNRRVNALENVVKPKIENTISYIKVSQQFGWVGQGQGLLRLAGQPGAQPSQLGKVQRGMWKQGRACVMRQGGIVEHSLLRG
jgi:hypothetical protein